MNNELEQNTEQEVSYCTFTCPQCNKAFQDISEESMWNPPDYKKCQQCEPKEHKRVDKLSKECYNRREKILDYVYSNLPKDKAEFETWVIEKCLELTKQRQKTGRIFNTKGIYNEAVEILGYYLDDGINPMDTGS